MNSVYSHTLNEVRWQNKDDYTSNERLYFSHTHRENCRIENKPSNKINLRISRSEANVEGILSKLEQTMRDFRTNVYKKHIKRIPFNSRKITCNQNIFIEHYVPRYCLDTEDTAVNKFLKLPRVSVLVEGMQKDIKPNK